MTNQIVWHGRDLIGDALWRRMVGRLLTDLEFWHYCGHYDEAERRRWAERIVDQTLAFLWVCADDPESARFSPSPLIDIGWHTFILYTREYHQFCRSVAGHYLHHSPCDEDGVDYGTGSCAEAVAAMRARGIAVDEELWGVVSGSCSPPAT